MPRWDRAGLIGLGAGLALALSPAPAEAEHVSCPGSSDVTCIPGKVAGRVVCAKRGDIVEYENVTAFCIDCHSKGSVRSSKTSRPKSSTSMPWGHAMEVDYPAHRKDFTDPSELYEAIKLTNGKVTCESCHGGANRDNHYISAHPRQPNLCLYCHHK